MKNQNLQEKLAGNKPLQSLLQTYANRHKLKRLIALMSVVVVLLTMNSLTFDAETLERFPMCGFEAHVHSAECLGDNNQVICGLDEHTHTDACYQQRPVKPKPTALDPYVDINNTFDISTPMEIAIEPQYDDIESPVDEVEIELGGDDAADIRTAVIHVGDSSCYNMSGGVAFLGDVLNVMGVTLASVDFAGELTESGILANGEHIAVAPVEGVEGEYIIRVLKDFDTVELGVVGGDNAVSVVLGGGRAVPGDEQMAADESDGIASEAETALEDMVSEIEDATEALLLAPVERTVQLDFAGYIATDDHATYMYDGAMVAVLVNADEIGSVDGVEVTLPEDHAAQTGGTLFITGDGEYDLNGVTYVVAGLVLPERVVTNEAQNVIITTANDEATLLNVAPIFEETAEGYADIFSLFTELREDADGETGEVLRARALDALFGVALAETAEARTLQMKLFNIGLQDIQTGEAVEPDGAVHVETRFDAIDGQDFCLYHIVDGAPVLLENAVVEQDGQAVGFDFYVDSLSPFALVYYTVTTHTGETYTGYSLKTDEHALNAQTLLETLGIQAIATGVACADEGVGIDGLDIALPETFDRIFITIVAGLDHYEVTLVAGDVLEATAGAYAVTLDLSQSGLDEAVTYKVEISQLPATEQQLAAVEMALSETLPDGAQRIATVSELEMVDISIINMSTGAAVEPQGPVSVSLTRDGEVVPTVIHFRRDGEVETLDVIDGAFTTSSFSVFTGAYTVEYNIINGQLNVNVDFTSIVQTGVDFSQATIISALSEGVAVSLSELENGYAGNAADAELNIAYNTACDYCGGAGFANWAGFEVVACDEGLSVADGEINVTRDGAVTLSDGVSTIYIVISNYSRLVSEIVGEAITIAPVSETAALPEGVAVFEEKADEAVFFRIAEMKGGQTLTMAASEDTEEVEVRTLYMQLFDIGIVNANGAVEPGFDVSVQADFAAPIEGQDFELYHILDGQPVLIEDGVVVEDGRATGLDFVTGSFSDYAVVWYTVDFGYNGSTFSLDGGSTVALVDILHELGIDIENNEIEYARFTNGDVVEVFCAAEDYPDIHGNVAFTAGTWIFRSLIPFSSHERLTVKAADGAVYIIVVTDDSTPMNLLNLTDNGNIHVTVATAANQNGNYNRTDTLALSFQFMIPGGNVTTARNNYPWVYDLSGLVGSDSSKYFTEIADEAQGILIDGDNVAGHYVVSDGKVYIYPDLDYIARYNESLSGSFTIQVTLNEEHNANSDGETFQFPGGASVKVTYEEKKLSHTKKVGGSEFGMANASSNTISGTTTTTNYGSVTVQENENGDYTLFYQIDMTANQKFQTLTVADTLSSDQTLNTDSIKVYDNGNLIDSQNYTSSANTTGFNINLTNVQPWRPYRVTYSATVPRASLNSTQTNTATYRWDGKNETDTTTVVPEFHEELQHGKLTGLTADSIYSGSGNVNMEADQNGKYYLYWKIRVRPNTNLNSLKVTDTISQGLTLDTASFALLINGTPSGISLNPPSGISLNPPTDNGFVINNLAALLPDGKVAANTEYQIVYRTEVNADYVANKTQVRNTAEYEWSGASTPDTVTVTPQVPDPVYPIGKNVDLGNARPGDVLTYTITLPNTDGAGHALDHRNHTITDYISAMVPPSAISNITVNRVDGDSRTNITDNVTVNKTNPQPANTDPYVAFTVAFPNQQFTDTYEITYTVTVPNDVNAIGKAYIRNTAWDGNNSNDETTTAVDYGDMELEKHFDHFDDATNETVWKLRVTVPAGKTVSNVVVHERDFAGSDYIYYLGTAHSINWEKLSVVGVDGTNMTNQYIVDTANNDITFASLSRSVEITLVTTSPVPFNNYEAYYVQNYADLKVGGKHVDTASDRATHSKADYGFEKDGTFDAETGITTWTVDINPRNNIFSPDFVPYFEDHIPAGMELVGNTISVSVNGNGNPNRYGQIIWQIANDSLAVDASDGDIGLINLPDAVNYEKVWGYGGNSPTGLSGMHYRITYQTRLTDAERAKVEGAPGAYAYTNRARVTDSDGKILKTTNDTVEYEYDHLIEKFDMTDTNAAGHIDYRVIVNENERNLNGGPGHYIELTDVISTDVSLLINTVKVYATAPENGDAELAGVTIGYNDNSRTLQIYIPDGHYARVEYSVKPNRSGITFTNKAVLKGGNITVSDEVQKYHNVTSGGTLTGTNNSITLYKFDQYNLRKPLQGAKFELYKCTTDPTTHRITGTERVLNTNTNTNDYSFTTDEFGDAELPINEQNTLYYWVETEAPTGYMLLDRNPHYFVTYKQYDTNTIKDNYPGHPAIAFSALPESVKNELRTANPDRYFDTDNTIVILLDEDEDYAAQNPVVLTPSQLNRTVTHVNKTVQDRAWALDDQVQAANGIKIASLIDGYIWRYGNVEETVKVRLNGVKQMVGRDMAAGEFNFDLYDNTDPAAPNWIETAKNIPGTDGQYTEFGFNEIAYVKPGTYHYLISEVPGGTRDTSVIYDNTRYQVTVIVESVPIEDSVEEDVVNGLRIASVTYARNGEGVHLPAGTVVRKQDGSGYITYTVGQDGKNTALFINKEDKASLAVSKTFSGSYLDGMTEQEIAALKNAVTFEVYEGTTLIKSFTYAAMLAGQMTLTAADGIETGHSYTVKEVLNAQAAPADARVLTTYAMNGTPGEGRDVNVQMADNAIQLDYNNDYEPLTTELRVVKKWYINETKTTLTNDDDEFEQQTYTEAPAGISQIAFWLQKRVDDASGNALSAEALESYAYKDGVSPRKAYEVGWEYFGGQENIYFVKASKNWSAMITDLPVGTYRIIEIERVTEGTTIDSTYDNTVTINGSTWRPVNAGNLFYSVGVVQDADAMDYNHGTVNSQYTNNNTPEKINIWAGSGTQDAEPGHELMVADKIVRIEFVKAWENQDGTPSTMEALNVASLTLRLQSNTADSETGWVNTDKTVTIIPNHETIRFDVSQKDANGHGLYYRVVETSMTLNDGTVLNEAQIRERFDAAFTQVIGRYVSQHNHMYPLDGGNFKQDLNNDGTADNNDLHNGRQQTLTNTAKPSGIRVTKRFVEPEGTTTDTRNPVYFKVKVRPRGSSTWADMVSTNVTAINERTKETVSPNGNNVFAINYDTANGEWQTLRFEYILRARSANGTIPADATDGGHGIIDAIKFVETNDSGSEAANANYVVSYAYDGTGGDASGLAPNACGIFTITNTRRTPTKLNVTKKYLDEAGNNVAQEGDRIYFRVVLNGKGEWTTYTCTMPNNGGVNTADIEANSTNVHYSANGYAYYIEYKDGSWETANFVLPTTFDTNNASDDQLLTGVYAYECDQYGNTEQEPKPHLYSDGTEATLSDYLIDYTLDISGNKLQDIGPNNMVPASTESTLTITNLPEAATIIPTVDKQWLFGNDTTPTSNWPGKVSAVTVRLYRYLKDSQTKAEAVPVGEPVIINAATELPYAFHRQYKYDDQAREYVYFAKEEKIRLLDSGSVVDVDLTATNPYLDDASSTNSLLINHTDEEEYVTIRVTKKWRTPDNHDKIWDEVWDEGQTITFTVKQNGNDVPVVQSQVANAIVNPDNTVTLTGTATGWPVAELTLPKYIDGRPASYYVTEDPFDGAHPATSETGYYEISYQLNGQTRSSDSAAACSGGTITLVNRDIRRSNVKVTKRWLAADGTTDIGSSVAIDHVTFKVMYRYKKTMTSNEQVDYENGGTYGTYTIHRQPDGTWEEVTLPVLPKDPDYKSDANTTYEAQYYIVEVDGNNTNCKHGTFPVFDDVTYDSLTVLKKGDNSVNDDQNGHGFDYNADDTITLTNKAQSQNGKVEIYKRWAMDGADITALKDDSVSATVQLRQKLDNKPASLVIYSGWQAIVDQYDNFQIGDTVTVRTNGANQTSWKVNDVSHSATKIGDSGDVYEMDVLLTSNSTKLEIYGVTAEKITSVAKTGGSTSDILVQDNILLNRDNNWHQSITASGGGYYIKETATAGIDPADIVSKTYAANGTTYTFNGDVPSGGVSGGGVLMVTNSEIGTTSLQVNKAWRDVFEKTMEWPTGAEVTVALRKVRGDAAPVALTAAEQEAVLNRDLPLEVTLNDDYRSYTWAALDRLADGYSYAAVETGITVNDLPVDDDYISTTAYSDYGKTATITNTVAKKTQMVIRKVFESNVGTKWLTDQQMQQGISFTISNVLGQALTLNYEAETPSTNTLGLPPENMSWTDGTLTLLNLPPDTYTITETDNIILPPDVSRSVSFEVGDNAPTADKATARLTAGAAADVTITITNSYDDDFAFDIDVDKSWVDENFEEVAWPGPVTIELWESVDGGDMQDTGRTITLTGDHTSDVFENVSAHRYINGEYVNVEYAIHETDSAKLIAITGDAANGYHVINTTEPDRYITPKNGEIEVLKKWKGDFTSAEKTAYVRLKRVSKGRGDPAVVELYQVLSYDQPASRDDATDLFSGKTRLYQISTVNGESIRVGDQVSITGPIYGGLYGKFVGTDDAKFENNAITLTVDASVVKVLINGAGDGENGYYNTTVTQAQQQTGSQEPEIADVVPNPVILNSGNNWYYKWTELDTGYTYFVEEVFPDAKNAGSYTATVPANIAVTVSSKDGVVDQSHTVEKGLITVTNTKQYGGLKLTKIVSVNGTPVTAASNAALKALVDGVYTFKLYYRTAADQSLTDLNTTIAITIANGAVASATKQTGNDAATPLTVDENGFVVLDHLEVGDYKIEEQPTTNGTVLSDVNVSAGSTSDNYAILTVTGNNTATMPTATFTNNKPTAGSLRLKKIATVDSEAPLPKVSHWEECTEDAEGAEYSENDEKWWHLVVTDPGNVDLLDKSFIFTIVGPSGASSPMTKYVLAEVGDEGYVFKYYVSDTNYGEDPMDWYNAEYAEGENPGIYHEEGNSVTDGIVISDLAFGNYTITETVPNPRMETTVSGGRDGLLSAEGREIIVTVTTGDTTAQNPTANATFTNNISTRKGVLELKKLYDFNGKTPLNEQNVQTTFTITGPMENPDADRVHYTAIFKRRNDGNGDPEGWIDKWLKDENDDDVDHGWDDHTMTIRNLEPGTYQITETGNDTHEITTFDGQSMYLQSVTVEGVASDSMTATVNVEPGNEANPPTVHFTNAVGDMTTVTATKRWVVREQNSAYDFWPEGMTVEVELLKQVGNGTPMRVTEFPTYCTDKANPVTLNADKPKAIWNNLPTKSGSDDITYTVREVAAYAGGVNVTGDYDSAILSDAANNYTILNTPKTGFTVRKAWDGWDNTDDYNDYTVEFAVTRRATARTYDIESGNWVDGAHIDEPLRFLFRSGDTLTTSRTLTITRQGKTANLTPAVSGGTGYNVSYADGDGNWQTALDGLEKFKANSATSITFYTYSVEEMCIRNGQGDEIYGYTTTYGLDESVLLNDAHQYAGQLIYENANGQRTTIYGYDASNMVGASSIAYTGTPGPYVGIDEIYDGATATITNTKADNASLRLNKVVQLHTDLSATVDKSLTNGTYAFTVTGPNGYAKYIRITAATANSATETAYTYETRADGNIWSVPAAVPAGGVPIEALVPGVYTITEDRPVLSATLPDGAGMYLKDIDLPDHPGNAIDIKTRTATVAVGAGGQGRVYVTYTNEVGPDTATMRKMVLDINDSSQADSFESTTEHTWEDTADYDIGDLVPYRVTATLPQAAYQAMDHYYFRIEDKMQNLLPKSWHMYAFVKSPDATVGEVGHWYQVDDYFTFAVDQELTETQNHSMPDTGRTGGVTDALHYLSVVVKMDETTDKKGLKGVAQGKPVTAWGSDTHSNIPKPEPDLSNVSATDFDPNHIQYLQLRYYAELLSTAVIGGDPNKPGLGNANDAMLYFDTWDRVGGDYEHTDWDRNRVYTYKLRVNKKDGEAALTGANFRLYKKYKSYVVPDTGSWLTATYNCGNDYWSSFEPTVLNLLDTAGSFPSGVTAQTAATNEAELTDVWVPVSGTTSADGASFDWDGIDDGKYCLFEITAPKGYQGLTSPIGMSVVATHEQEATVDNDPKWCSGHTNIYPDGFIGYFVNENNGAMNLGNMLANIPNTPYPGIDIYKIDGTTRDDAEKPLSGAKFKIGQWNGTNYEDYIPAGGVSAEAETNSAGRVTFPKVEPGEYRISETVLPNGYVKLVDNDIYFSVAYNAATGMHITRYDKPADAAARRQITPTQNTMDVTFAQAHVAVKGDPEYIVSEAGETDEQPVEQPVVPAIFTVGNMPGAELPSTGGVGSALIYIVGSIFTLLAAALLIARKRMDGQEID